MATIKEYLNYAELAQASYGDLTAGMLGKDNIQYFNELTRTDNDGEIKFSTTQANNFADRYKVIATSTEYGIGGLSSFDAVLFEDTYTGEKIFAIRGSQETWDYVVDVAELAAHGTIITQTTSMENFYQALVNDNKLGSNEHITVTGHSLGGFLAQDFTAHHADIVDQTYTYNAPGYGGNEWESSLFPFLHINNEWGDAA